MTLGRTAAGSVLQPSAGYDRVAECYDEWDWQAFWTRNEEPVVDSMLRTVAAPRVALDLGTGTGRYCDVLRRIGHRAVIGIDVSFGMLSVARRKPGFNVLVNADIGALPFADRSAGLTVAARSLSHVADLDQALAEIARVLAPGGTLVVSDLHAEHAFDVTKLKTPRGEIAICTWKHTETDVAEAAARAGLMPLQVQRFTARECLWLPPADQLTSLDRTGRRTVFFVGRFRKGT
jgi:ubiquinone/menaquinone biosynthesis C-methylase UbiE